VSTVSNPYYSGSNHLTDPTYGVTTTAYDALSRVTQTTKQDHSISSVSYNDNCTTATDEAGKKRKVCADALGRMTTVFEDPTGLNYETDYQYDLLNNLIRVDQKGSAPGDSSQWHTRLFTYDSLSRLITAQNPENGTMCYGIWSGSNCVNGYDPDGNLLKKTDARNITVTYAYDALSRLTDKTYSDGVTPQASYRYDYSSFLGQTFAYPIGREVATMVAGSTPEAFTSYDPMGRLKQTTQCNPGVTGCKTFTASYDLLGDLTSLAYPSGLSVNYQYDSAARLYSATDSSGWNYASLVNTSQSYFLPAGAMGQIDTPNFKYTNSFNNRLQPTEIAAKMNVSGSLLLDKTYTYNPPNTSQVNNGDIYTVTNLKDSSRTQTFTYDALNRLAAAQDTSHWSNTYTYDSWGNLTKKLYGPIPAGEYMDSSADTGNHLAGYNYDLGGNMTGDGVNTYVYDGENRISSVAGVTYTYDADGRRVKKSSGTNYWYGPSGESLAETDSSGNWTNYIFFGGVRLARNVNGDIKYYISDHLHSTAVFADKTGTVLDDNDFYPWGGVVPGIGQTTSNNAIKFTGKYRDTESTLDYFGARYYANVMGRFMSPDWAAKPVTIPYAEFGDPQSLNLYSYVRNSPIIRVDPDGHDFVVEAFQDWGFEMGDLRWGLAPQPDGEEQQQQKQHSQQQQPQQPLSSVTVLGKHVTIIYDQSLNANDKISASNAISAAAEKINKNVRKLTASEKNAIQQISSVSVVGSKSYLGATGQGTMTLSVNYLNQASAAWVGSLFGHEAQHYLNAGKYSGADLWKDEQSAGKMQLSIGNKIGFTNAERITLENWIDDKNRAAMQQHMLQGMKY
jgi:RHS repeat-associated protein